MGIVVSSVQEQDVARLGLAAAHDALEQSKAAALVVGAAGIMVEVHPDP